MEEALAPTRGLKFVAEVALQKQTSLWRMPFEGMDKSGEENCKEFMRNRGSCFRGKLCPYRHTVGEKSVVCKHWLRSLCKKGDDCDFLHEYVMEKMPECQFYVTSGECNSEDCRFLHTDPETRRRDCPQYSRGFCRHGSECQHRHVRKALCLNYLAGFCPDGPQCKLAHPAWETSDSYDRRCHRCGQLGHRFAQCPNTEPEHTTDTQPSGFSSLSQVSTLPPHALPAGLRAPHSGGGSGGGGVVICHYCKQPGHKAPHCPLRPPDARMASVICYKCHETGHFANKCPK